MKPLFVLACAAAIVLAACGTGNYDAEASEERIRTEFNADESERAEAVACPIDVPLEADFEFSCDVLTEDGQRVVVDVVMKSSDGDFSWEISGDQVDTKKIAAAIEKDLAANGVTAQVECPGTIFAAVGESFDCTATDADANQAPVVVTIDESELGFSYDVLLD